MLKRIILVLALFISAYALPSQAAQSPVFGGGSVKTLSHDQMKGVTAKGAYSDYYGYYGYVNAYNAYIYGYYGYYYGPGTEYYYYYYAASYAYTAYTNLYYASYYAYYGL